MNVAGRSRRRKHNAEFKAQLVEACQQPGVSSAAIALANGLNANLLRRWVNDAEQRGSTMIAASKSPSPNPAPEFIPLQLPAPKSPADIRIELKRSGVSVSVTWPASAAAQCATWMREVLR